MVTGSHRSGTTWIGRTISQHQDIRYINEPFNAAKPHRLTGLKLNTWFTHFESSSQKEEIIRSFDTIFQSNPITNSIYICKAAGSDLKTPFRFIKHLMLESYFKVLKLRILIKDPIALLSAGWLYENFHFNVICMIRNPLSFIGSVKITGWDFDFKNFLRQEELMTNWLADYADRIEYMCKKRNKSDFIDRASLLWNILHFVISDYQQRYSDWLFLKHEEIASRPDLGFQKIFDYLELEMNDMIQKYIKQYTSDLNPRIAASNSYQQRNSREILNLWKERLTKDEIDRVIINTSDIASKFYADMV